MGVLFRSVGHVSLFEFCMLESEPRIVPILRRVQSNELTLHSGPRKSCRFPPPPLEWGNFYFSFLFFILRISFYVFIRLPFIFNKKFSHLQTKKIPLIRRASFLLGIEEVRGLH